MTERNPAAIHMPSNMVRTLNKEGIASFSCVSHPSVHSLTRKAIRKHYMLNG